MKSNLPATKKSKTRKPFETVKVGSISIPIYAHSNVIPQRDPTSGKIIYETTADGKKQALVKYAHTIYTIAYYEGSKRVRCKFSDIAKARKEADLAAIKLTNGDTEALKLKGHDRTDYVRAMQKLREWRTDANLNLAINDYVSSMMRLPEHVTMQEVFNFYLKRHPIGLPPRTVREVVDELVESKTKAGKSDVYIKDLKSRLGHFADTFRIRISSVTGNEIETYIRGLKTANADEDKRRAIAGRTQNNVRQLLNTLFKFAIKRGYVPKDHDEMTAVDRATVDGGEIEVFTPAELRKLFAACSAEVKERGKLRTREDMIPYLAVAAFCGLRAAEIQRLDWSEVHLTGPEHFIEIKAGNAKTASRRTVPIPDNCAAWLARFAQTAGPVVKLARTDKQLFIYLAKKSGVPWKHNGLRHSFISYRLAIIKDVGQVSLEAGNSPGMIFKHYRQLVRESEANDWFSIAPAKTEGAEIITMPSGADTDKASEQDLVEALATIGS